jgi:hypothetical protein
VLPPSPSLPRHRRGLQVGEGDELGDLFDIAAVRHQPAAAHDQKERLAGVRVRVPAARVGDIGVTETDRLYPEPVRSLR